MKTIILLAILATCWAFVVSIKLREYKCKDEVPYLVNDYQHCECKEEKIDSCWATTPCSETAHCEEYKKCKEGSTWEQDCNHCVCMGEAGAICTDHRCNH